jgi:hypothetical protein
VKREFPWQEWCQNLYAAGVLFDENFSDPEARVLFGATLEAFRRARAEWRMRHNEQLDGSLSEGDVVVLAAERLLRRDDGA